MDKMFCKLFFTVFVFSFILTSNPADSADGTYGDFGGLGIVLESDIKTDLPRVREVIEGTPAENAGLRKGDLIKSTDGESLEDKSLTSVLQRTRGEPGTTVEISVIREGSEMPITFNITREILKKTDGYKGDYISLILILIILAVIVVLRLISKGKK